MTEVKCLEEKEEIYLPQTITILNKKNTILMLARSRLPEKQIAIYAGRQHFNTLTLILKR